jgi:hypothetical protein
MNNEEEYYAFVMSRERAEGAYEDYRYSHELSRKTDEEIREMLVHALSDTIR